MVEKKRPHFSQRIRSVMGGALIFAGTIFLNTLGIIGLPIFSEPISIWMEGARSSWWEFGLLWRKGGDITFRRETSRGK
jgi:hypothetical protein